jgi:CBS domain-containing protein
MNLCEITLNLEKPISNFVKPNPLFVSPYATLGEVAKKMAEEKKEVAIVREDNGEIKGLVTSADLFDALRSYLLGKDLLEQVPSDIRDLKVTTVMKGYYTKEFMEACGLTGSNVCISLGAEENISNAIRVMSVAGINHILITGEGGVIGTLSDSDLVKVFLD